VVYDSTLVTFTYDEASGTIKTIHLTHNGFISSIRYRQIGSVDALTSRARKKKNAISEHKNVSLTQLLSVCAATRLRCDSTAL